MNRITLPNDIMLAEVTALLSEGRPVVIKARGNSMLPFIRNDRDSVEIVRSDSYEVGDIVLSEIAAGKYVLHRLFRVEGENATLKGDGNLRGTESCRLSDISGRVRCIIRPSGRKISCGTRLFGIRSALWRKMPNFCRRVYLAIYRRLI